MLVYLEPSTPIASYSGYIIVSPFLFIIPCFLSIATKYNSLVICFISSNSGAIIGVASLDIIPTLLLLVFTINVFDDSTNLILLYFIPIIVSPLNYSLHILYLDC